MSQSPPAKRARLSSVASDASDFEPQAETSSVVRPLSRAISAEEQPPPLHIPYKTKASARTRLVRREDYRADKEAEVDDNPIEQVVIGAAGAAARPRRKDEVSGGPKQVKGQSSEGAAPIEKSPPPVGSPTPEPRPRQKARAERNQRIDDLTLDVWRAFDKLNKEGVAIAAWIVDPKRKLNPSTSAALDASKRAERSSVSTCSSSSSSTIPDVKFNSYISNTVRSLEGLANFRSDNIPATFLTGSKRFESVFDAAAKSLRKSEVKERIFQRSNDELGLRDELRVLEDQEKKNEEQKAAALKKIEEEWEAKRKRIAGQKSAFEQQYEELRDEARADGGNLDTEWKRSEELSSRFIE
ncbi:hypothetical protein JCM5350_001357 [Sporobolomyces pararoseus]